MILFVLILLVQSQVLVYYASALSYNPITIPQVQPCQEGWILNPVTGSCYKIIKERVSWHTAKSKCASLGAQLISIRTSQENDFVKNMLIKIDDDHGFWNTGDSAGSWKHSNGSEVNSISWHDQFDGFWLGANDIHHERTWVWTDGSPVDYTDWHVGQPNNIPYQDCLEMWWTKNELAWNDAFCLTLLPAICKLPGLETSTDESTESPTNTIPSVKILSFPTTSNPPIVDSTITSNPPIVDSTTTSNPPTTTTAMEGSSKPEEKCEYGFTENPATGTCYKILKDEQNGEAADNRTCSALAISVDIAIGRRNKDKDLLIQINGQYREFGDGFENDVPSDESFSCNILYK